MKSVEDTSQQPVSQNSTVRSMKWMAGCDACLRWKATDAIWQQLPLDGLAPHNYNGPAAKSVSKSERK